jgi:hypothetical protein
MEFHRQPRLSTPSGRPLVPKAMFIYILKACSWSVRGLAVWASWTSLFCTDEHSTVLRTWEARAGLLPLRMVLLLGTGESRPVLSPGKPLSSLQTPGMYPVQLHSCTSCTLCALWMSLPLLPKLEGGQEPSFWFQFTHMILSQWANLSKFCPLGWVGFNHPYSSWWAPRRTCVAKYW